MPVYEYICRTCDKPFEIFTSISEHDPAAVKCPTCGGKQVDRIWSHVEAITSKKS